MHPAGELLFGKDDNKMEELYRSSNSAAKKNAVFIHQLPFKVWIQTRGRNASINGLFEPGYQSR
jgi:hypothetical protein